MDTYNHKKIEDTWKSKWFDNNIYKAIDFDIKPKKYILAELPYPSGKTLHLGHMMRYTVPEIYSRYLRMTGYNVLFPMGWDSFGLPAETYAIKEGITPQEAIKGAAKDYKKAMQDMGYAIDWDREINTCDPNYYKWTQWMFLKLYENGLAVIKEMPVWWCKELGVLADEEVLPDDTSPTGKKSERGGYPVERKMFKQWVLDIPAYADRLLEDLDKVDYLDSVKHGQINWIGKKEGANIDFKIMNKTVTVFTTRPDTIYGVTYLALAPQHPILREIKDSISNFEEVQKYLENAEKLTELEKQTKEKTGMKLANINAIHPLTHEDIPVYVADYILTDYGTGAIMGVPGHDERDMEFATKYGIKILRVIQNENSENESLINSNELNGLSVEQAKERIIKILVEKSIGKKTKTYKIREQIFSRQRYWGEPIPLIYRQDGSIETVKEEELPLTLPVMKDFFAGEDGISPLEKNTEWSQTLDSDGNPAKRETDTMPTWAGSNWYYIRYIDPKNAQDFANIDKLKYWMPVDKYFGDAGHTTAHLIYSRFWYKFLYDQGVVPQSEPYQWRMSGGMLLGADHKKMSKSRPEYVVSPKEVLRNYGADAARIYLAFIGPYDETYPWNNNGIKACYRLLTTLFALKPSVKKNISNRLLEKEFHKTLKNVTEMIENLKMNTYVSEIMKLTNLFKKEKEIPETIWKQFILMIAPIAPFLAEELWQEVNNYQEWQVDNSVHMQMWPKYDAILAKEETINLPIQINGKLRATIDIAVDLDEKAVTSLAYKQDNIKKYITNKEISNIVYVKNKILNIVLKQD